MQLHGEIVRGIDIFDEQRGLIAPCLSVCVAEPIATMGLQETRKSAFIYVQALAGEFSGGREFPGFSDERGQSDSQFGFEHAGDSRASPRGANVIGEVVRAKFQKVGAHIIIIAVVMDLMRMPSPDDCLCQFKTQRDEAGIYAAKRRPVFIG